MLRQKFVTNIWSDNITIDEPLLKLYDDWVEFEKTLHKKYRVGIYDCRHYVNRFTRWSLDKPTPVWKLHRLWEKY